MLEAEEILAEEHKKFSGWQQSLTATPAISKMQEKFEDMRAQEMRKVRLSEVLAPPIGTYRLPSPF